MKKILLFVAVATLSVMMVSCKAAKPEQTIANLKEAITGESNASAKYAAFSERAAQDSLMNISKLFAATSAAEAIHAKNHMAVLNKLGDSMEVVIETVVADSTLANLNTALNGENYELTDMYPKMVETANLEKAADAVTSFSWALEVEKTHASIYQDAISKLTADGNDLNVSTTWYVCPKCGETFSTIEGIASCPICATTSTTFQVL
ncbi:MAG: ferritin family protein [Rikenellaceae bacterium]